MSTRSLPLEPGVVHAWYFETSAITRDTDQIRRLVGWLSAAERVRYDRFHHDLDRHMFLVGRAMARALVGRATGVRPSSWRWREGPHGRPEIDEPGATLHFNIAHSAGLVVCALADGREVGVDVEHLDRRSMDRAIVRRYCSPAEADDVDAQPDWHRRFLTYWTLKEAYLKACGLGVSVHLSDVNFTLAGDGASIGFLDSLAGADTRWLFRLMQPTERHLVAVAAATADGVHPHVQIEPLALDVLAVAR
jgi:4'-phosphopantetheinyl transferase